MSNDVRDYNLDPPEFDDPESVGSTESIILPLDLVIDITSDGTILLNDDECSWAEYADEYGSGGYECSEFPGIHFEDKNGCVEKIHALLYNYTSDLLPGSYRIQGTAILNYEIEDVDVVRDDEGSIQRYDEEYADVDYLQDQSDILEIKITPCN